MTPCARHGCHKLGARQVRLPPTLTGHRAPEWMHLCIAHAEEFEAATERQQAAAERQQAAAERSKPAAEPPRATTERSEPTTEQEPPMPTTTDRLCALLRHHPEGLTSQQIGEHLGLAARSLGGTLAGAMRHGRMHKAGDLWRLGAPAEKVKAAPVPPLKAARDTEGPEMVHEMYQAAAVPHQARSPYELALEDARRELDGIEARVEHLRAAVVALEALC